MNREAVEDVLKNVKLDDNFTLRIYDNGFFEFISFNNKVYRRLGGGYKGFFKRIAGISLDLFFPDLESILNSQNTEINSSETPVHMTPYIHKTIIGESLGIGIFEQFPLDLKNDGELNKLKILIEQFWVQDAKLFFDYWSDFRAFLPFIETSDISLVAEVLGNRIIEEKMIIWKLCDHPGYSGFVEERKELLQNALKSQPKNIDYSSALENIISMEKKLSEINSLYQWDPAYLKPKPFKGMLPKILS